MSRSAARSGTDRTPTGLAPRRRSRVGLAVAAAVLLAVGCGTRSDQAIQAEPMASPTIAALATRPLPEATLPDGARITLELAITPEEIAQGLMFRPSLPADRGMLFLFGVERRPAFWMKNTIIPLDLVFLDASGRIVDLIANAEPCAVDPCPQYLPSGPAWAVLELPAGAIEQHRLARGSALQFDRVEGYPAQPAEQPAASRAAGEE